ncbi:hypothetical protein As57867_015562, partial [Aphanomyces stellatus]
TLFVSSIAVYVVAIGLSPGVDNLPTVLVIFNGGFTQLFHLSDGDASLLSLPACFASIPGFLLATGNIITALADSKLVAYPLHRRHPTFGTPVRAMACASILSFAMCFGAYYEPDASIIFYDMSMFFGCVAYTAQCVGYIFLKRRYKTMARSYCSPFGIWGAIFAMMVFTASGVSILGFQNHGSSGNSMMLVTIALLSIFYHGYAKSRQTMSNDERKVLFFAHIANHNKAKEKLRKRSALWQLVWAFLAPTHTSNPSKSSHTRRSSVSAAPRQADVAKTTA